jgi:hypothetical protein
MALMVACGSGGGDDKDDADDDGLGGEIDIGDDGDVVFDDEYSPVLVEGRAWCADGSDSSGMLFFVEINYADPQGDYDVESGSLIGQGAGGGTVVFDEPLLVCRDGECIGSFRDGLYPPITCSTADDYEFIATLIDRSGNPSAEILLVWDG